MNAQTPEECLPLTLPDSVLKSMSSLRATFPEHDNDV